MSNPLAAAETLEIGASVRHRGVVVTPLFSRAAPRRPYVSLAQGRWLGASVREVSTPDGRVRQMVMNATPSDVLVHEDELFVASRERALLVAAGSIVMLGPAAPLPPVCGMAWDPAHADDLDDLLRRFPLQPRQCGAVFSINGRPVRMDLNSCPEAFSLRYPVLLRRLVMDAVRQPVWVATPEVLISCFTDEVVWAPMTVAPTVGLGERLVVDDGDLVGQGLVLDGEVVHLTVGDAAWEPHTEG